MNIQRPDWIGRTAVCLASGPSLSAADVSQVGLAWASGRAKVIAVSDTYRLAPWADAVFSADLNWWKLHHPQLCRRDDVKAELWTGDNVAAARFGINRMRMANRPGLGTYQLHTGGNSGYMAVNLAFLWGAARIVLLGFDMQATDGRKHFFGDHPSPLVQQQNFGEWRHRFDGLAADLQQRGVAVVNCTRTTALECFPRADLAEQLEPAKASA